MEVNLRQSERLVRAAIGVIVVGIGITFSNWWGGAGLVLLLTSLYGTCPIHAAIGSITTALRQKSKAHS